MNFTQMNEVAAALGYMSSGISDSDHAIEVSAVRLAQDAQDAADAMIARKAMRGDDQSRRTLNATLEKMPELATAQRARGSDPLAGMPITREQARAFFRWVFDKIDVEQDEVSRSFPVKLRVCCDDDLCMYMHGRWEFGSSNPEARGSDEVPAWDGTSYMTIKDIVDTLRSLQRAWRTGSLPDDDDTMNEACQRHVGCATRGERQVRREHDD